MCGHSAINFEQRPAHISLVTSTQTPFFCYPLIYIFHSFSSSIPSPSLWLPGHPCARQLRQFKSLDWHTWKRDLQPSKRYNGRYHFKNLSWWKFSRNGSFVSTFSCILSSWWIANRIPCCFVSDLIYFESMGRNFAGTKLCWKTFWTSRWIASQIKSSLKFNLTLWIIDFEFCDWNVFRPKPMDVFKLPTWSIGCDSKMWRWGQISWHQ